MFLERLISYPISKQARLHAAKSVLVFNFEQTSTVTILGEHGIMAFSKIKLVVYYQCCVLIGWATTRLYLKAPLVAKSAGFEN